MMNKNRASMSTTRGSSSTTNKLDLVIGQKYKMIKKVGSGAFGEIYKGKQKRKIK